MKKKSNMVRLHRSVLYIVIFIFFLALNSCDKDETTQPEQDLSKVTLSFNSDSILYRGTFYRNTITVDTASLVTIVKNGHAYFYYSGFGSSYQSALNDTLSAKSILFKLASLFNKKNQSLKFGKLSTTSIAGVEISDLGNNNYRFDNIKRRMVGLKMLSSLGTDKVIMPPKGPLLDHNLITLLLEPNSADLFFDKSTYERKIITGTNCELFGSVISAGFAPTLTAIQFQNVKVAYQADRDYFVKVNCIDGVLLSFDIIEEIIGVLPTTIACGDLVGYIALEPFRLTFIAAIDQSSDPLVFKDAAFSLAYETLKRTITCACTGITEGACGVLHWLQEALGLIPFLVDQGIRNWDVMTTETYGSVFVGPLITQFSDNFDDGNFTNNPHWDFFPNYPPGDPCHNTGTAEVVSGQFHVIKTNAPGCGTGTQIEHSLDLVVNDNTKIAFDINPVFSDVGDGAGWTDEEYPAFVDVRLWDASGDSSDIRFCYNYRGGVSHTNGNLMFVVFPSVSQNVWQRNQLFRLRDYVPTAVRISRIIIGGNGWDYEGLFDNISVGNL